jgi:hypothetical protein
MNDLPWEDGLLERKVESDQKDFLKTFVAFANSVRPGHTAVVLTGERDDGIIQGVNNPDDMQKKVRRECERIYPDIVWRQAVYEKDGKYCVRVEIEYSGDTPHFGEAAWIRRGSETVKASDQMFQHLIELRTSVVRELAQWVGKNIVIGDEGSVSFEERIRIGHPRWAGSHPATLLSVNQFWITFKVETSSKRGVFSEPVERLMLAAYEKIIKIIVKA